jgi:hypothetical protein
MALIHDTNRRMAMGALKKQGPAAVVLGAPIMAAMSPHMDHMIAVTRETTLFQVMTFSQPAWPRERKVALIRDFNEGKITQATAQMKEGARQHIPQSQPSGE